MMERTRATEEAEITETRETDRYLIDETPELKPSRQQERDHAPDNITTGYDPYGATRIGIGSAGGDARKLVRYNEGRHPSDGSHSAREAARDKKRITQALCSRLDVTQYQQREAVAAISSLNLDRFGRQKRIEKVALGTIKVIVEWDRCRWLRRNPNLASVDDEMFPDRMIEYDPYCDLLEEHEVSRKDLYSVSQLVKRELKKRDYFGSNSNVESGADVDDTETTTSEK